MKNKLVILALSLGLLFSGCNKETFEGEVDLNNDGNSKMIFSRYGSNGFILYSQKNSFEIDTVYNFGDRKPFSYGFAHLDDDEYPDLWYNLPSKNGDVKFKVSNKGGKLLGEEAKEVEN